MFSILRPGTSMLRPISTRAPLRFFHASRAALQVAKSSGTLSWNEFLVMRAKGRRVHQIASGATALLGVAAGWVAIANIEIDPTEKIAGFEIVMVLPLVLIACGFLGYLCGPSLGDIVFKRILIRSQVKQYVAKNAEFLKHIQLNRPDPTRQSYSNPMTDYYGEKIGSLKDYRQWLRDGKAYKRKSERYL